MSKDLPWQMKSSLPLAMVADRTVTIKKRASQQYRHPQGPTKIERSDTELPKELVLVIQSKPWLRRPVVDNRKVNKLHWIKYTRISGVM